MASDDLTPSGPDVAISAARNLTESLGGLTAEVNKLNQIGRRNRHMIWGLACSLAFDFLLTGGLLWSAVETQRANSSAEQAHQAQVSICRSSNVSRQQNRQLWEYVLSIPPSRPPTAAQQKQRADFRQYLARVFAPRDCGRL